MRKFTSPPKQLDEAAYVREREPAAMRVVAQRMRREEGRQLVVERRPPAGRRGQNPFEWLKGGQSPHRWRT
jgi:hypothetical protein